MNEIFYTLVRKVMMDSRLDTWSNIYVHYCLYYHNLLIFIKLKLTFISNLMWPYFIISWLVYTFLNYTIEKAWTVYNMFLWCECLCPINIHCEPHQQVFLPLLTFLSTFCSRKWLNAKPTKEANKFTSIQWSMVYSWL